MGRGVLQRFRLEELAFNGANDLQQGSVLGTTESCFLQQHGKISEPLVGAIKTNEITVKKYLGH